MTNALLTLAVLRDGQDEQQILEITPRIILRWELACRNRSGRQLHNDAVRFEYLYEVAWVALGKPGDFDQFCETTDVAFTVGDQAAKEVGPDPTQPDQSTENS